jgi:hypothetical protein
VHNIFKRGPSARKGAAAMVVVFSTLASTAIAQSGPRYPWDLRKPACLETANSKTPDCEVDHWPNFLTVQIRLSVLYQQDQYELLDRALREAMSTNKRFTDGDSPARAVYWAFRNIMHSSGLPHEEKIARWRKAVPESYFVQFAQARLAYDNAWRIRGGGYGETVSKESWDLFDVRLAEAKQLLLDSSPELRNTPIWHHLLLAIMMDSSRLSGDAGGVFGEAVKRWPQYYDFYDTMAGRLVPQWGGSWQAVESFISGWSTQLAASEGASLYARLYSSLHLQGSPPGETLMDWEKMKQSFIDLTTRYPAPKYKNRYASYACFKRDMEAFKDAMRKLIVPDINQSEWFQGHSYEGCMRWAGI